MVMQKHSHFQKKNLWLDKKKTPAVLSLGSAPGARVPRLRVVDVLVVVAELSRQLVDNLFEYDRVYVLAEHVEQEPVAHLGLLDDDVDALLLD